MSRQRTNNDGILYNPGEITCPDDGYKELANCIVAQAADDYVSYILKPHFEEEVEMVKEPCIESAALYKTARLIEDDPQYIEAVKRLMLEVTAKAKANVKKCRKKITAIEKLAEKAETLDDLKYATSRYKKYWKDNLWAARDKNLKRKMLGRECEDFIRSDLFELMTNGSIDPDKLLEKCRSEAERIRKTRGTYDRY